MPTINGDLSGAMQEALTNALEAMCFTAPCGDIPSIEAEGAMSVRVGFEGEASGVFQIAFTPEAARSVSSAFLAIAESDVSAEQEGAVVHELANVICGATLSAAFPEVHFTLATPQNATCTSPCEGAAVRRAYELESGQVCLCFR